jgi:asparagine synthase (glutamine-hydrolysing)
MAKLVGLFNRDVTPIDTADRKWLVQAFENLSPGALHMREAPGLLLAHCGIPFDSISALERQPIQSSPGNVITWDGRLDNRDELLDRLGGRLGENQTDPAIALAMYEAGGEDAFANLIGDWSLAIWDRSARRMVLASDYGGVRPLYYQSGNCFKWSSTLADLVSWTEARDLDADYIAEFLLRGASRHRTPYPGIYAVPPGRAVCARPNALSIRTFWQVTAAPGLRYRDEHEYEQQFRLLFRNAVQSRLRASGPVHSELSGGLDSSAIVVTAHNLIHQGHAVSPRLVSVSYHHPSSQDERFYRVVEECCGLDSIHLEVGQYPFIAPGSVGDAAPLWWEARHVEVARRLNAAGSSVFMTGQIGDLVMGNWLDDSDQVADLIRQALFGGALKQAFAWSQTLCVPVYSVLWRAVRMNLPFQSDVESSLSDSGAAPDRSDSLTPAMRERALMLARSENPVAPWMRASPGRRKLFRALSAILEDRRLQTPEPLQPVFYTHPFADRRLVEFLIALPAHVLCRPGEPRRLMRQSLSDVLPPAVLNRRSKATFNTVFTGALKPIAAALLRSPEILLAVRGYVDPANLLARLRRFVDGLDCNEPHLRHAILLECWLRHHEQRPLSLAAAVRSQPIIQSTPRPRTSVNACA